jgi:hypothetical protein
MRRDWKGDHRRSIEHALGSGPLFHAGFPEDTECRMDRTSLIGSSANSHRS